MEMRTERWARLLLAVCLTVLLGACDGGTRDGNAPSDDAEARVQAVVQRVLDGARERIALRADSMDSALQPVSLLTPAEEGALRRYLNPAQLSRARQLGISRAEAAGGIEPLQQAGRLVPLEDSTQYWVVRRLEHSVAAVTPDTRALLTEIGERFQARLDSLGLPPLRIEVTSVLRTAETQAALRRVNPNAAGGVSTHEFGTTLDLAYNSFAAPEDPLPAVDVTEAPWLEPYIDQVATAVTETIAARRSRELQAILGRVLQEMQREGKVMVIMERGQPVYHVTVAQRYAD